MAAVRRWTGLARLRGNGGKQAAIRQSCNVLSAFACESSSLFDVAFICCICQAVPASRCLCRAREAREAREEAEAAEDARLQQEMGQAEERAGPRARADSVDPLDEELNATIAEVQDIENVQNSSGDGAPAPPPQGPNDHADATHSPAQGAAASVSHLFSGRPLAGNLLHFPCIPHHPCNTAGGRWPCPSYWPCAGVL